MIHTRRNAGDGVLAVGVGRRGERCPIDAEETSEEVCGAPSVTWPVIVERFAFAYGSSGRDIAGTRLKVPLLVSWTSIPVPRRASVSAR